MERPMSEAILRTVQRAPPLAEQIYLGLRQQLRSGSFDMGERLVDASLAKALNVSRTPVREALARLVADGLLETGDGGFQIPVPTVASMEEIFDVRRLIEPPAAVRATRAMSVATHEALDRALEAARDAKRTGDGARFLEANYAFRSAWIACVPNSRLRETILRFDDQAGQVRRATLVLPAARAEALELLENWAAAFKSADATAAGEYARGFIDAAARFFSDLAIPEGAFSSKDR
jgi:DNA-binding GntR family transcriptional regulator